ncbi:MAG: ATP-binding protein [bacterium]|nr:ATP-binding protein [bacterium]
MVERNPFSPTFGASPPVLAGRDEILEDVDDALETGPTHPDYTTLFIGVRGAGKTVMLNAVEDLARQRGWLAISDNASPTGFVGRLTTSVARLLEEHGKPDQDRRIKGVTAAGFGVEFELDPNSDPAQGFRELLTELGRVLDQLGTGLIITIDELQSGDLDEIRQFGAVLQHVTRREQLPVAFAGAALAQIEETLLSDDVATFLQRCSRYDIDRLDPQATAFAIAGPIQQRGGTIEDQALSTAVEATSGYAFMVQLVGFHSWKAAPDPTAVVTADDVATGIAEAERRIGRLVLAPTWRSLSDVDRRFLIAMARDDGPSRITTIAERLEVDNGYAGVYRHRLIKAGMIIAAGKGRIDFAQHSTRQWLRTEAAYLAAKFPDDDHR